ncbi:MAG: helix-turn-helix domain-containing protein [Terracoccus sp.]
MLNTVAVIVQEPVAVFELGVMCEIFGVDRTSDGVPAFDFKVCSPTPGVPLKTPSGISIVASHSLDDARDADLVAIPGGPVRGPFNEDMLDVLRDCASRDARVMSVCSGAFTLGAAGLLDGRTCATHWRFSRLLSLLYPDAMVDLDVLYVQDGPVLTSAGTAAGIDACLHVVRSELGSEVANVIARRMIVAPHRIGGQRQYIDYQVPIETGDSGLQQVMEWAVEHLDRDHAVPDLAARAHMSERTFTRRFSEQVGTTPHRWLTVQRVMRARHLLEATDLDMERTARRCGFPSSTALRRHFIREIGLTPHEYRRTFAG